MFGKGGLLSNRLQNADWFAKPARTICRFIKPTVVSKVLLGVRLEFLPQAVKHGF